MVGETLPSTNINNIKTLRVEIIIIFTTSATPLDEASNYQKKQYDDEQFAKKCTIDVIHQRMLFACYVHKENAEKDDQQNAEHTAKTEEH